MPIELGAKTEKDSGLDFSAAVRAEVKKQVGAVQDEIISVLAAKLRNMSVVPPAVHVAAPNVSLTPTITVKPADVDVGEATDLAGVEKKLDALHGDVQALTKALLAPVTRTVKRDAQGRIESIKETR